jgi:hypothetical protein
MLVYLVNFVDGPLRWQADIGPWRLSASFALHITEFMVNDEAGF